MEPITLICGPTAVGKTAYAVALALEQNAEIISADSGQIYRGLDIGTAKPTEAERRGVPFHLVDILDPTERFSAADFRILALKTIAELQTRGKKVIVAGGTGLYLKVLEQGIFEGPAADPEIRKKLEQRAAAAGIQSLLGELEKIDPVAAQKMDKRNRQRIIRALEVYEITGRPISEFWEEPKNPTLEKGGWGDFIKIGLTLPRDELNRRIDERVDRMIARGWIEETKQLLEQWGPELPALQIIGYKELVSALQGKISTQQAVTLIKTHTRQYAKRQVTWFKRDPEIRWELAGKTLTR